MNFRTIDLYDENDRFAGRAVICPDSGECVYCHVSRNKQESSDVCEAFLTGATYGGNSIVINHIEKPIVIQSSTKLGELRETIINQLKNRSKRREN